MGITIGQQMAAFFAFLAIMVLAEPIVSLTVPGSTTISYFGKNGIVNGSYANYQTNFAVPVLGTANSTTGFGAYGTNIASSVSVLSFVYGGLGLLWKSMWNFPNMIIIIFNGVTSNISFLPAAVTVGVGSIAGLLVAYTLIGNFWKFLSGIQKSDLENLGQ